MTVLPRRVRPPTSRRAPGSPPGGAGVVAVPGLGLSVDGWRACLTLLGSPVGAVALALPAFGMPAAPGAALDPEASARRLIERLDATAATPAVLVGHSAACQVVAEVARRAPHRVAGLVLVGPSTDPRGATWPSLTARWLRNAVHEPATQVPLLVRDYAHSGLVTFARTMEAARRHRLDAALADCAAPVLLVRGSQDALCPRSWLDRLAAGRSDRRVATVVGGAHMLPVTHPDELATVLRPFVRAVTGRGRPPGVEVLRGGPGDQPVTVAAADGVSSP